MSVVGINEDGHCSSFYSALYPQGLIFSNSKHGRKEDNWNFYLFLVLCMGVFVLYFCCLFIVTSDYLFISFAKERLEESPWDTLSFVSFMKELTTAFNGAAPMKEYGKDYLS
jgi:hypothetical protein